MPAAPLASNIPGPERFPDGPTASESNAMTHAGSRESIVGEARQGWAMGDPALYPSESSILPVSKITSTTAQSPSQDTLSPARCDRSSFSWLSWASPRPPSSRRGPVVGSCASTRRTPTDDTNWDLASLVAVVTVLNNWRERTVWLRWKYGKQLYQPYQEVERW